MSKFLNSLFGRVVVALILGIALGAFFPHFAESLRPLGDGFLKLIKMVIGPIVFCVVVSGMANAGDLKKVGRVGLKAVIYFEIMTTLALGIGLILAWLTRPGVGMNIDLRSLDASSLASYAKNAESLKDTAGYLMKIIPETAIDAFAKGDILQILVFAVLFGSALSLLGDKAQRVNSLIEELSHVFFRIIGFIIKLAPLGVLGAIAFTTGKYGVASLKQLGYLVAVFYLSCFVFVAVVLGTVMRLAGFSVFKLIRYLREELSIVLGTASSDAVLPQVMRKLEYMGVKDSTVGLVIPTGYSFNLDGFSIYLTLAVLFIAQATNTPLSTHDLIVVLLVSLVTSKGAHGIPGSAIVILAATLSAIPAIPVLGLVLILPVDWFVGIARAVTNLIGNCVATVVVAVWENDIDRARATRVLNRELRYVPAEEEGNPAPVAGDQAHAL
ncbi:C4-dicarboxylate transporter DctA [Burkholderia stabilis]|uniref:Aerobic C4-dicarboxylate transport protein,C4-dicarboxylate transporter DctA,Sodium:dicarboxylate symporter family n=1 Tax=Burkholderia stabilis TaxID=95485 RepID=A0AAJ5T3V6_9BURK|nr:C4-dicarboxylate transporter DctA [Burkholderia stabilis]VBB11746.1 Aerobic C4-dicarboxylate transport protein,C4-dicarboxylate transporter DctA,Sodium:dicarboxylate symporter family [Burkholderia stabilis]HDR9492938.1 C4-dicarboxylate transporter DctA [Burkholderia stabilis]HDR9523448.1 C4-dicarboxylate transporter DctA [Burkholderia stabilis]HDR9530609.1 C4-dicarboxylate transporter DctA [Burkholderia stabilis]HDR9538130.1 C4-dicarboxylate transporter DctA [Burkholderia stabilis]